MIRLMRWRGWTGVEEQEGAGPESVERPASAGLDATKADLGVRNKTIALALSTSRAKMIDSFMELWLLNLLP
jgi:hypothetical protein